MRGEFGAPGLHHLLLHWSRLGLCAFAATASGALYAQSAQSAREGTNDDIIVTALKRDTTLLNAPASISALDSEALRDQQITDVGDLSQKVPGLVFTEQFGIAQVAIRGISLTPVVGGLEAPVAMHLNGVYLPSAAPIEFLFNDVASVEVLRGPQGTLYGRNATGGAINFVPAAPEREFGGFVDASYANYDTYRLEGAVTGPVAADVLSFRLSGLAEGRTKGFVTNLETGNRLGEYRQRGVRGILRFTPSPTVTIDALGFLFDRHQNVNEPSYPLGPPSDFGVMLNPDFGTHALSFDQRRVRYNSEGAARQNDKGAIVVGTWKPSDAFSIVSRTAYLRLDNQQMGIDCDGSQIESCIGSQTDKSRSFQQEINVLGQLDKPGLSYILGGYYGRERQDWVRAYVFSNTAQGFVNIGGFPVPNGTLSFNGRNQVTRSYALFADLTYELSDKLALLGGARWARDERDGDFRFFFDIPGFGMLGNCANFAPEASAKAHWTDTTFKAGAQYKPDDASQLYAQFQQGFKSGGFNPASCGTEFKPEKVNAYEVGYKAQLLDRRLTLNLAAFHYDYRNLQVYVILSGSAVGPTITNADSSVVDGFEASAAIKPVDRLSIDLAGSWIPRAKYNRRFLNTYTLDPTQTPIDLNGNRLPRAPKVTLNVGTQYRLPVSGGDLTLRGELYYNSGVFYTAFNTPGTRQGPYALANAFVSYKPDNGPWELRAWVRNIADRRYLASAYDNNITFFENGVPSTPRSYGIGAYFTF